MPRIKKQRTQNTPTATPAEETLATQGYNQVVDMTPPPSEDEAVSGPATDIIDTAVDVDAPDYMGPVLQDDESIPDEVQAFNTTENEEDEDAEDAVEPNPPAEMDVVVDDAGEQPGAPTEAAAKGSIAEVIAARAAGRVLKPQAPTATPAAKTVPAGARSSRIKELIAMRSTQKHMGKPSDVISQRLHGYSASASVQQVIAQRRVKH